MNINSPIAGDTVSTDLIKISNILNTHFSRIGPSLALEIKDTSSNFTDYITPAEQIFKVGGSIMPPGLQFNSENTK